MAAGSQNRRHCSASHRSVDGISPKSFGTATWFAACVLVSGLEQSVDVHQTLQLQLDKGQPSAPNESQLHNCHSILSTIYYIEPESVS